MKCISNGKIHWSCCVKPIFGDLLWLGAIISLVAAWISRVDYTGLFWGLDEGYWYLNALVLGTLAIGCKINGHDCKSRIKKN